MSDDDRPALPIEGCDEDFDLNLPPTSGQEYLRRVIQEARDCPRVVVADIDTTSYVHKQTLNVREGSGALQAPAGLGPTLQWQKYQAAEFSCVRQKLSHWKARLKGQRVKRPSNLPPRGDVEAWCRLSFGRLTPREKETLSNHIASGPCTDDSSKSNHQVETPDTEQCANIDRSPPLLSIVAFMDQPTVISVLEYHINWFEATGFSKDQGEWLYALLVCLEKPLDPEACSLLRHLARVCSTLRATLSTEEHPFLTPLNLFICLVARYFDQKDLADDG